MPACLVLLLHLYVRIMKTISKHAAVSSTSMPTQHGVEFANKSVDAQGTLFPKAYSSTQSGNNDFSY